MSLRKSGSGRGGPPAGRSDETGQAAATPAPTDPLAHLVHAVVARLREEVALTEGFGDDPNLRFRRLLDEALAEVDGGLTAHSAARTREMMTEQLDAWFERRRDERSARNAELATLIQSMGKALKNVQGGDQDFHDGLETHLERLKQSLDSPEVQKMRSVSRRLQALVDATATHVSKQQEARERRIRALSDVVQELHRELDDAKVQLAEDPLTQLYNRGSFDDRLQAELQKFDLAPYCFSLIMIDLDLFKLVNDRYGHVGGDRVLQAAAQAIQATVLRSNDFCARYGGEEMAVLLADSDLARAAKVAEEIRARLEGLEIRSGSHSIRQTASFGVAEVKEGDVAESLIARADQALYKAKANGRNRVELAPSEQASARTRREADSGGKRR